MDRDAPFTLDRPDTLGALRASGWRSRGVRAELRENLMARLAEGAEVFPGIVGYEETVLPQLQTALLAEHSVLLLGLRGQAKTRLVRALPALLDEWQPVIEGSPLNEDPYDPVLPGTRARVRELGDDTPIVWRHREERYQEKLATPDVTVADLIGDIDPIRASRLGLDLSDPEVIHYGIVPRANRGLFAVNELPDLAARIQVALLNVLEEGDIQLRGFPLRLPLDVGLFFTANPEDYTNRGSIITPLRDRIASQILTHYPETRAEAAAITDGTARVERRSTVLLEVPDFVREAVEQVAFEARASELVDQGSGVSARLPIALYEAVVSSAERRALLAGEPVAVARVGDLLANGAAVHGKLELVYDGEREGLRGVTDRVLGTAVRRVFQERLPDAYDEAAPYEPILRWFQGGGQVELSDALPAAELAARLEGIPGLAELVSERLELPAGDELRAVAHRAAAMELVLEGLAQSSLLARQDARGRREYRDMLGEMARGLEALVRWRYTRFDVDARNREELLAKLQALFHDLLLQTGGDVEEALRWMEAIDRRYGIFQHGVTLDDLRRHLEERRTIAPGPAGARVLTRAGEAQLRAESLDQVFAGLKLGPAGEHRVGRPGSGGERLPETRPWRYGDALEGLDVPSSLRNALRRGTTELREEDLEVHEVEHRAACATVLLLDLSHSMILYGEDRITPAKRVAMALAELIRTRYPKDDLAVVTFGDMAEEVPVDRLPYVQVGPFHTNTRDALRRAQDILRRKKHGNRQVFLITDGKPSALTEPDGEVYKNPFGLDRRVIAKTLEEADRCRRGGIPITTFMLTDDPVLVEFVEEFTAVNRGRAYFSGLGKLGDFLLVDYVRNRRRSVR